MPDDQKLPEGVEVREATDEEQAASLRDASAKLTKIMEDAKHDQHLMPSYGIDDMEYPLTVEAIQFGKLSAEENLTAECGKYVAIRPCDPKCEGKTYLGVMLGDFPSVPMAVYRPSEKKLLFATRTNPAIFVPDLGRVVWGMESWWGPIKDPEHLREITDESIQNLWYVQALKALFPTDQTEATCENCGAPCEYDSDLCLCERCQAEARGDDDARGDHGSD